MQLKLYENIGFLAASTVDAITAFELGEEEGLEDVARRTSDEPPPASLKFMAPEEGDVEVMSGLGSVEPSSRSSPRRRPGVTPIDAMELSRLLTSEQNVPGLTTAATTVVVDCRPYLAYSASHVVGAHNVCFPSLLERRRLSRQTAGSGTIRTIPLENVVGCDEVRQAVIQGRCRRIVVYDEDTEFVHWPLSADVDRSGCRMSSSSGTHLISVLQSLADSTSCDLHFLRGL